MYTKFTNNIYICSRKKECLHFSRLERKFEPCFYFFIMAQIVYNAIVFTGDPSTGNNGFITYRKINSLNKFEVFLNSKYPDWKWYTFFDNNTKMKLGLKRR